MPDRKKKILFFLPGGVGGAERMTLTIGSMLPKNEYHVKFVIVGTKKNILKFVPEGYDVATINIRNIYCAPITRMMLLIRKEKPDYTFSSTMYLNIRVLLASKIMGVKCVVRNDNYTSVIGKLTRWGIKHTYPLAQHIIAQQEEMADDLISQLKLGREKVVVRHNPLDTAKIDRMAQVSSPYPQDNSINYLWIGNFLKTKGQDILVRAFKIVHGQMPQSHLYLIGTTPPNSSFRDSVYDYAKENGLLENVHFLGFQANPYQYIKNCDCYVLPSRIEGLPNSLIEAMYLKRPVVATRCIPIISRMVKDGYNGITVKPLDPQEMAEAMISALQLHNFQMTYKPSGVSDFTSIFK